jgi:hypothetical protein
VPVRRDEDELGIPDKVDPDGLSGESGLYLVSVLRSNGLDCR